MLSVALWMALGQIAFHEQALPGLRIGPVTPFTGLPETNYAQADLNGDGAPDLLMPPVVWFQEGGAFPESRRVALPPAGGCEADVVNGRLLYRTPGGLQIHAWTGTDWRLELEQPLDWPGRDDLHGAVAGPEAPAVLRRFTADLDADGQPELVGIDADGVHLFRRQDERYTPAGMLTVFPTTVIRQPDVQAIWPPSRRRVVLPEQQMSCRLVLQSGSLAVVSAVEAPGGKTRYRRDEIAIALDNGGMFQGAAPRSTTSAEMPEHLRPCNLNGDGVLDFAGTRWALSEGTAFPVPILETWASLDGGTTFHVERSTTFHNFRPHTSFVDMDGDGALDLVVEGTPLFERGLRETVNQLLTRTSLPHTIRVVRQSDGGFADAGEARTLEIALNAPPMSQSPMLSRYQAGELVNPTGDFDGDGAKDLLVRPAADRVEILRWRPETGFSRRPVSTLTIPAEAQVAVADINGDGRADVALLLPEGQPEGRSESRVHLSKGAGP